MLPAHSSVAWNCEGKKATFNYLSIDLENVQYLIKVFSTKDGESDPGVVKIATDRPPHLPKVDITTSLMFWSNVSEFNEVLETHMTS